MKKSACLFLLVPILLQAGGMMLICLLLQLNNYQRIESILEKSSTEFEILILTTKQFEKAKGNDKEVFVKGKIYDIKEIQKSENTVKLVVYHDYREESLISLIEKFFDNENSGDDFSLQVLKLLISVYTFSSTQLEFTQPHAAGTCMLSHSSSYISFAVETLTPPPDSVI